jgi:hypothetical protein
MALKFHVTLSKFRKDTSITLSDCGTHYTCLLPRAYLTSHVSNNAEILLVMWELLCFRCEPL